MKLIRVICWILLGAMALSMLAMLLGCGAAQPVQTTAPAEEPTAATAPAPTEPSAELPAEPTQAPAEPALTSQDVDWDSIEWAGWTNAGYAFVYDTKDQHFRYVHGDLYKGLFPASMTKLMTAYVGLLYVDPDEVITVGPERNMIQGPRSAQVPIWSGDRMTFRELLEGMLIPSGCDAAYVVAAVAGRVIAGDADMEYREAVKVFVAEMNVVAQQMGLENSSFNYPDGQTPYKHYICMADHVKILERCLTVKTIRNIICNYRETVDIIDGRSIPITSTSPHLNENSRFYIPECVGGKTGSDRDALYNLVTAFWVEDRYIIVGVLRAGSETYRAQDVCKLFEAFGKFPEAAE